MTQISAKIIADSKNPQGDRLTTFVVTFPRFILAELNTHRMFSRNSASSRAIPFEKMVKAVQENPFIPIAWQKDHKGMQGSEYMNVQDSNLMKKWWLRGRDEAISVAKTLNEGECTKQLCNRLLEPFMWHTVIITSSKEGLENFFELRCPKYQFKGDSKIYKSKKDVLDFVSDDPEYFENLSSFSDTEWLEMNQGQSEIHMMALAEAMWDAYNESTPKQLIAGEWHIPFGDNMEDVNGFETNDVLNKKIKIATARCARVSYTVVGEEGKESNYENDIKLHNRLLESKHLSPFEHVAQCMTDEEYSSYQKGKLLLEDQGEGMKLISYGDSDGWCHNLKGFKSYRSMIEK